MSTTAMNNLWAFIESLGLSAKNRKWLAEKLIDPTYGNKSASTKGGSLRNAFSGDWSNDIDSVSYAQMLREESVINNREEVSW